MVALAVAKPTETRPYRALGERIAAARHEAKLSQRELAANSGISEGYIPQIESGRRRPDPDILRALTRWLPVGYEELATLAHYADAPAEHSLPLKGPEYRQVLSELQDEFSPEELQELGAIHRAVTRLLLRPKRKTYAPSEHRGDQDHEVDPIEPGLDLSDLDRGT